MQKKLIILMKEKNITNKELSDIIGVSEKQIGKKIKGIVTFNGDEMFEISNYLGMKIDDIFLPTNHQIGDNTNSIKKESK